MNRIQESMEQLQASQELKKSTLQYDENVSVEDCHGMTIGEIQNRIDSCQQNHGKGGHGRPKGHHGNASGH